MIAPRESRAPTALARLLDAARFAPAEALATLVATTAAHELGATDVQLLLVDPGQRLLTPLRTRGPGAPIEVDTTLAGLAYRRMQTQVVDSDAGWRLWIPVIDGAERLGVLGLTLPTAAQQCRPAAERLAVLLAALLVTKGSYSDALHRATRRDAMSVAAEIQWGQLPPLNAQTDRVAISGILCPAYDIGGDVIDYVVDPFHARLAIVDAMGHGLSAAVLSSVALGACRSARRAGHDLGAQALAIEEALVEQFGGRVFVTALLAELALDDGTLRWVNRGHPWPLLLRDGHAVSHLQRDARPPLGMALAPGEEALHEQPLEPGDRVVLYSDGVIEARDATGQRFGTRRLADFLTRAGAAHEPLPETTRRLANAVIAHHHGRLSDDATLLIAEWQPEQLPLLPQTSA